MSRRSEGLRFFNFSGGLATKPPVTSLALNQAVDIDNINLLPSGGFEKRRGNSLFNATAMNGGASVHGLGYHRQSDGDDFLLAICGDKIYKSDSLDGTMDDITGAVTITTGNNNIWTHSVLNDKSLFVGGDKTTDVPIKWDGSGDAEVLGGTPPVGTFGLAANNRFFIGNTVANPSRINWCIFGDPEDWTGVGSGSQDVSRNDGDTLVGACQIGVNHMLLFKQNSIHDLVITSAPFPLYPLFKNVGAVSPRGIVEVDGMVYFITPEPEMKATDGSKIYSFPDIIDDVFSGLNTARLKYLHGTYYKSLGQIWWVVSDGSSATHDLCIVWDIARQAWLKHTTGFKMNCSCIAQDRRPFMAAYDGKIYEMDKTSTNNDASETSPGTISCIWRSGWQDLNTLINAKTFPYVDTSYTTQTSGTFNFSYGFDFDPDRKTETISMAGTGGVWGTMLWGTGLWGGSSDKFKMFSTKGLGKVVQFAVSNNNAGEHLRFNGFEVPIKENQPYKAR
jgi:hypothetical protein